MRPATIVVSACAALAGSGGCSPGAATSPGAVASTLSALVVPTLLGIGESGQATMTLRTGTVSSIVTPESWRTTDPAVASVGSDGVVSGTGGGVVTITGTYRDRSATVTLRILSGDEVALTFLCGLGCGVTTGGGQVWRMTAGQVLTLIPRAMYDRTTTSVVVYDVQPGTRVTWTTSDASVLSVTASGHVTAVAAGTASLTATWLGQSVTVPFTITG